jgi:CO/xanthine dehydrogenase Mo-binding subunit
VTPVGTVEGAGIVTLEGLGSLDKPHPIQQAFINEQASQCGFCLNGVILAAKAFLDECPDATDAQIREALATVLCRCGVNVRMLRAIRRYADGQGDGMSGRRRGGSPGASLTRDARRTLNRAGLSRRSFLKQSGVLIVGFGAVAGTDVPAYVPPQGMNGPGNKRLDSWIAVAADGRVTAYRASASSARASYTAQMQLGAEELAVPLDRVTLIQCDTGVTLKQGTTSGAQLHPANFNHANLALAAATAREALVRLASARLAVPIDRLTA